MPAEDGRRGSWLAVTVVGAAVALALLLATWEILTPPATMAPVLNDPSPVAAFAADVQEARVQVDRLKAGMQRLIDEQKKAAAAIVDPGPPPPWYHPFDHAAWKTRVAAQEQAVAATTAAREQVFAAQQRVETATRLLADKERLLALARAACNRHAPDEVPGPLREAFLYIWNALLRPLLHWLLVAALLLFALNRLTRLALIQGWLGEERL